MRKQQTDHTHTNSRKLNTSFCSSAEKTLGSLILNLNMAAIRVITPCSLVEVTDVSEVLVASVIRTIAFMMNDDFMAQQPRQPSSYSAP
jgi:transcription initiation factor TFIIIB Brf1 subunit/transcription initiation factor TFIIB